MSDVDMFENHHQEVVMSPAKKWLRNKLRQIFLICLQFFCNLFIRNPSVIFLVYGDERHKRACWSKRRERSIGLLGTIGLIRFEGGGKAIYGLTIATTKSREEIEKDPALSMVIIDEVQRRYPKVRSIALAGQFPSWVFTATHSPAPAPCVTGMHGTCFTVMESVKYSVKEHLKEHSQLVVAVVGGAGYTGSRVVELLAKDARFAKVIALDPRIRNANAENRAEDARIIHTSRNSDVSEANLVVVLTAKGDDALESARDAKYGSMWLDDTHPTMGRKVVEELHSRMVRTCKITSNGNLWMFPGLPDFAPGDIPGCLLEALLVALYGRSVLTNHNFFSHYAKMTGVSPNLGKHPEI